MFHVVQVADIILFVLSPSSVSAERLLVETATRGLKPLLLLPLH